MPELRDDQARAAVLCDVIYELIVQDGPGALSYRTIASRAGISSSTLHDHFPVLPHLLKVAAGRLGHRRLDHFADRMPFDGLAAMLPRDQSDRGRAVAWSAFRHLARTPGEHFSVVMNQARASELQLVGTALQRDAQDPLTESVLSTIEGLEGAMVLGADPLDYERARAALTAVEALTRHAADPAA